jgi:nucleoid-associated protein YgaU/predicted nucleic acid-binding Zn ribbon protein
MSANGEPQQPPGTSETATASRPLSGETFVVCPKCQARNDPASRRCSVCRADLLPGRGGRQRLGYMVFGIILAALVMAVAVAMASQGVEVPLCASPISIGLIALALFFGALGYGLGRTPEYEKYLNRAQRHLQAAPEQALADFSKALELAPQKLQSGILKQRGQLLSRLGRAEQALADLSAHAAAPQQGGVGWLLSNVSDIDVKPSTDQATLGEINRLQKELVESGARQWVGYCQACRAAVAVDAEHKCTQCGTPLKEVQLIHPEEHDLALAKINREQRGRRRRRSLVIALAVVALFVCVVLPLASVLLSGRQARQEATPTPRAAATPVTPGLFQQNVFSFSYPAGWWEITPREVSVLLSTSLKGMTSADYSYIGGVYTEGLDNCKGCAQILVIVATNPALNGTLTDEQYEALRAASQQSMGARLLSHQKVEVAGLPAAESIHVGLSGDSELLEYIIVPPQPGVAYMVSCSSHKDSFAEFETVFRAAINSLRIGEALPTPVLTATPRPTTPPAAATTYTVQPGDTLSQIAKDLGVTMDALAAANGLAEPYIIQPGQILTVPVGGQ